MSCNVCRDIYDNEKSTTGDELVVNEMSYGENIRFRDVRLYPELCKALDRCKINNRDACLIVNAVLKDFNLLTAQTAIDLEKFIVKKFLDWKKILSSKLLT